MHTLCKYCGSGHGGLPLCEFTTYLDALTQSRLLDGCCKGVRDSAAAELAELRKAATGKLALKLFHGRKTLKEQLDDWGDDGPVFVCDYVHTTYGNRIHTAEDREDLRVIEDCVYYDGVYYGDWSVFMWTPDCGLELMPFDNQKAMPPIDGG